MHQVPPPSRESLPGIVGIGHAFGADEDARILLEVSVRNERKPERVQALRRVLSYVGLNNLADRNITRLLCRLLSACKVDRIFARELMRIGE